MKNIHVLKTDKPSRLYSIGETLILSPLSTKHENNIGRHIYITSDEEIKDIRPYKGKWQLEQGQILNKFPSYLTDLSECKLVIMTTDQDLIKDGVQAIDDEFIEWFVKNPTCEWVTITELNDLSKNKYRIYNYKEAIPKEEYKKQTIEGILETLDTKQLGELNIFLKGVERKEAQNKELYDDLVDLLERLRPIYKEVTDLHWKYEQKRLDLIELLKKK
jgi:hypothetical protein